MLKYNSAKLHQELKQQFVLERLLEKGVTQSKDGLSVHKMDYEELKYELVLLAFKDKDAENEQNQWF